jgi:hypothetical protein
MGFAIGADVREEYFESKGDAHGISKEASSNNMKATYQTITINKRSDASRGQLRRQFPATDYTFQAAGCADLGRCDSRYANSPSFRGISENYFATEARHNFRAEAAMFAVIVLTSALPILNGASALFHFLRSTGVA